MLRFEASDAFEAWLSQCPLDPSGLQYSVTRSGLDGVLKVQLSWAVSPMKKGSEDGSQRQPQRAEHMVAASPAQAEDSKQGNADAAEISRLTSSIAGLQKMIAGAPEADLSAMQAPTGANGGQAALAAALLHRRAQQPPDGSGGYVRPSRDEIREVMNMASNFLGPPGGSARPFPKAPGGDTQPPSHYKHHDPVDAQAHPGRGAADPESKAAQEEP